MFRCERWYLDTTSPRWSEEPAADYTALQGYLPKDRNAPSIQCDSKDTHYYHLSEKAVRNQFAWLAITGFVTQPIMCVVVIVHDVVQLLLCALPLSSGKGSEKCTLIGRVKNGGIALVHIITIPLFVVGLQAVAVIGIFYPENMRKSYSQLEGWIYLKTDAVKWGPVKAYITLAFFPSQIVNKYAEENVRHGDL
jgi:hypothetical protein